MLDTLSSVNHSSHIIVDETNKRLVINGYARGFRPSLFSKQLINFAETKHLEKIWLWALPADVPEFLRAGFCIEGNIFRGDGKEFSISLGYYVSKVRGLSKNLQAENDLIYSVRTEPIKQLKALPHGMELKLLNASFVQQISRVLKQVFISYPTPLNPQYIASLIQNGNIFAGAFLEEKLIAVSAAYPDTIFNRCEMTDCATIEEYRGHSLTEHLLFMLEHEVQKRGSLNIYTLARAQSFGMNRVFYKLGYRYQGRLINNCHIAGSFEDMNLWVR